MMKVLITGGSRGLGAALAAQLLEHGASVVSLDRTAAEPHPRLLHITCDLADRDAVDRAWPVILAAGGYDMAIFNAGISATGRFEELPRDAYRRLMTVNAETPMVLAAGLVRAQALRSHLCFVSSLSHYTGYPGAAAYAASKDAIAAYAKSVRKPFGARGISVTLACPGPMRTDQAGRHAPDGANPNARMEPEIAALAILAGTLAGNALVIPGGGPKTFALAGKLFPHLVTRQMRRIIYDKLGGNVW